ncbi:MAG: hypothetical protein ACRDN0_10615 [Trebonia sp.]
MQRVIPARDGRPEIVLGQRVDDILKIRPPLPFSPDNVAQFLDAISAVLTETP